MTQEEGIIEEWDDVESRTKGRDDAGGGQYGRDDVGGGHYRCEG